MIPPAHIAGLVAAALACASCVGAPPDPVGADAGDADAMTPPPGSEARLAFEFRPAPDIPGAFPGPFEPTVREVRLELRDVRAIGDAATGSADTRVDAFELRWHNGYDVPVLEFSTAPPGLYSALLAKVVEFEISGTVVIDGIEERFEIEDDEIGPTLNIPLGLQLAPGENRVVAIAFDGTELLAGIDWPNASVEDGTRKLEDDDAMLADVRARMLGAFYSDDSDDSDAPGAGLDADDGATD